MANSALRVDEQTGSPGQSVSGGKPNEESADAEGAMPKPPMPNAQSNGATPTDR
jgi:hypothetical protein